MQRFHRMEDNLEKKWGRGRHAPPRTEPKLIRKIIRGLDWFIMRLIYTLQRLHVLDVTFSSIGYREQWESERFKNMGIQEFDIVFVLN